VEHHKAAVEEEGIRLDTRQLDHRKEQELDRREQQPDRKEPDRRRA
jgi:hypothetical protein